jgi:glycosyltransferase involved in cell wall biosynthesis
MLRNAILSLKRQTLNAGDYEIIVVDNGSIDLTGNAVHELMKEIPNLRYAYEKTPGLSHARNRGADLARGEVVAFIDDDALAAERWLEALLMGYRAESEVCAVGGKIYPVWPFGRPHWLPPELESCFGKLDLGENLQFVKYPIFPFGGNMSILRRVILDYGGFSPKLGHRGASLLSCEESEFFCRLSQDDVKVLYVPDAIVYHNVNAGRLSRVWVLKRSFAQGRSDSILEQLTDEGLTRRRLLGRIKAALRHSARLSFRCLSELHNPVSSLLEAGRAAYYSGYAYQGFRGTLLRTTARSREE